LLPLSSSSSQHKSAFDKKKNGKNKIVGEIKKSLKMQNKKKPWNLACEVAQHALWFPLEEYTFSDVEETMMITDCSDHSSFVDFMIIQP
jgi:hypothetical protein